MDVSFISATLLLPAVVAAIGLPGSAWRGEAVVLVKPQFEAGRDWIGKGGIVRDPEAHALSVLRGRESVEALHGTGIEVCESPITGTEGNREFLMHVRFA